MRKTILLVVAMVAVVSCDCVTQHASADGIARVRHNTKVRHVDHASRCGQDRCVVPPRGACPDAYSCYSLYGVYGPFGGASYWSRYTSDGWGYRW
jgi:hypothetical protein